MWASTTISQFHLKPTEWNEKSVHFSLSPSSYSFLFAKWNLNDDQKSVSIRPMFFFSWPKKEINISQRSDWVMAMNCEIDEFIMVRSSSIKNETDKLIDAVVCVWNNYRAFWPKVSRVSCSSHTPSALKIEFHNTIDLTSSSLDDRRSVDKKECVK